MSYWRRNERLFSNINGYFSNRVWHVINCFSLYSTIYCTIFDIQMTSNKYRAVKVKIDGYSFDSKAEAQRYRNLCLLVRAGAITDFKVHPKYILQEAFIYHGKKILPITYTADFEYKEYLINSSHPNEFKLVVEDVKGGKATQTRHFADKVKIMKYKYPEYEMRIAVV